MVRYKLILWYVFADVHFPCLALLSIASWTVTIKPSPSEKRAIVPYGRCIVGEILSPVVSESILHYLLQAKEFPANFSNSIYCFARRYFDASIRIYTRLSSTFGPRNRSIVFRELVERVFLLFRLSIWPRLTALSACNLE